MKTKYLAPIVFLIGIYLILSALDNIGIVKISILIINPLYLAISTLIFATAFFSLEKLGVHNKIKQIIARETIKNSVHIVNVEGVEYYFVGFRVIGKETTEEDEEDIDYSAEMQNAINALSKHQSRKVKVAVVTLLDPEPGSAILFFAKKDDVSLSRFYNEALYLKHVIEGMAPHLTLEEVNLKTKPMIPLPQLVGTVVYAGYISQKKFEVVADEQIDVGEFDIELGHIVGTNKSIGIRSSDVFRHIAIFGATGSGKTNTSALLAKKLYEKGFDVVILDWHGEYHNYLPNFNYYGNESLPVLNPLGSKEMRAINVADMIGDVLKLTDPQRFALQKGIEEFLLKDSNADFKDLINLINTPDFAEKYDIQKNVILALVRNLSYLFTGMGEKLISKKGLSYKDLAEKLRGGNVIDLATISDLRLRRLYGMLIVQFILEYFLEFRPKDRKLYLVLEEAQNYLREENIIIERALQEIRKFGVGLCIVTQSPTTIDPEVLKNTNIKIVHSIKSNQDKRVVADSMGLTSAKEKIIDKLDVGEAILVAPNIKKEIIVKIDKVT